MSPPDPPAPSDPDRPDPDTIVPSTPEEVAFVRGLEARGEAVERRPGGELPPGATHEIVGRTATGLPIVKRVRFAGRPY